MTVATLIAPPTRRKAHLWRSWTLATAGGEVLGFAVSALVGVGLLWRLGEPDNAGRAPALYLLLVIAGMGEGAVLGAAQSSVLRPALPAVSRRVWVGATAAAGGFAWALGLLPSTLDALVSVPQWLLIAAWAALAAPLLLSIGVGQWLILRRHVDGAGRWVWANALGWLLGLPITFIGPALVPDGSPPAIWAGVFLTCGLVMGAVVGAVTGRALCTLLAAGDAARPPRAAPVWV